MSAGRAAAARQGYVGMEVTKRPPFVVLAVDDLLDQEYVLQGQPGYANEPVRAGDMLLRVEGVAVSAGVDVQRLHELLAGSMHSMVELTFARSKGGEEYSIKVRRHGMHEHERRPAATPPASPRSVDIGDAEISRLQARIKELEAANADADAKLRISALEADAAKHECEEVKKQLEELKWASNITATATTYAESESRTLDELEIQTKGMGDTMQRARVLAHANQLRLSDMTTAEDQLRMDLAKSQNESEGIRHRLEQSLEAAKTLEDRLSAIQRDSISNGCQIATLEENFEKERARAQTAETALLKAEQEVVSQGVQVIRLQDELNLLEQEHEQLQARLTEIDTEGAASMMALEEQVAMVAELEEKIAKLEAERSSVSHDSEANLGALREAVAASLARASSAQEKLEKAEAAAATANEKNARITFELEQAQSECQQLTAKLSLMDTQSAASEQALNQQLETVLQLQSEIKEEKDRTERAESDKQQAVLSKDRLQDALNTAEIELQTLRIALDDKVAEHRKVETSLRASQMDLTRRAAENMELDERVKQIQSDLERLEQERQILSDRLATSNSLLSTTQTEGAELQQKFEACQAELEAARKDCAQFRGELKASRDELIAHKGVSAQHIMQLEKERQSLSDELGLAESQSAAAQRDLNACKESLQASKDDLARARESIEAHEADLAAVKAANSQLGEELARVTSGSAEGLDRVVEERKALAEELAAARALVAEQQERAGEAEAGLVRAEKETAQVSAALSSLEDSLASLQDEMEQMKRYRDQASETISAAEGDRLELQEQIVSWRAENARMKRELDQTSQKLSASEKERLKLQEQTSSLDIDRERAVRSLEEDRSAECSRADLAKAALANAEEQAAKLREQCQGLADKVRALQEERGALRSDLYHLQVAFEAHEGAVQVSGAEFKRENSLRLAAQADHEAAMQSAARELEREKVRADNAEKELRDLERTNADLSAAIKNSDAEHVEKCRELLEKIFRAESEAATQEKRAEGAVQDLTKAEAHHLELFDKISKGEEDNKDLKRQVEVIEDLKRQVAEETKRADAAEASVREIGAERVHLSADREALAGMQPEESASLHRVMIFVDVSNRLVQWQASSSGSRVELNRWWLN